MVKKQDALTKPKEENKIMNSEKEKIPTRVLPGFMELLPSDQIVFNKMLDTIRGYTNSMVLCRRYSRN